LVGAPHHSPPAGYGPEKGQEFKSVIGMNMTKTLTKSREEKIHRKILIAIGQRKHRQRRQGLRGLQAALKTVGCRLTAVECT